MEQFLINALMDNLPDHIYFKDVESRYMRINNVQAKSLGLNDPAQAVGKRNFDFFTDEHECSRTMMMNRILFKQDSYNWEEKLTRPDRPDTWSSTTKLPMFDNDGK